MGLIKDVLYSLSNKRYLKAFKNQSIFPYYHIISDKKVGHIKHLYNYSSKSKFENDLSILLKHYSPIDLKQIINSTTVPENHFLLSFDDGLREVYDIIFPILKQREISAIFFLNPNFIDNKNSLYKHDLSILIESLKTNNYDSSKLNKVAKLLNIEDTSIDSLALSIIKIKKTESNIINAITSILGINIQEYLKTEKPYLFKEQIQEMIDSGFYFGGHTMSHPRLLELTLEEQKKEIIDSIKWVKSTFNLNYSLFAFPFSDKGISKNLIDAILEYDPKTIIFGNAGIKKDINKNIIQRFSLEDPAKDTAKRIVTENLYKFYNKLIGKYRIVRP